LEDFGTYVVLVETGVLEADDAVLVSKDAEGRIAVEATTGVPGPTGAGLCGGTGLAVGLLSPRLLADTAIGKGGKALVERFLEKRASSGIDEQLDSAVPPGTHGLIAVHAHGQAHLVERAVRRAAETSVARIGGAVVAELKAGIDRVAPPSAGGPGSAAAN